MGTVLLAMLGGASLGALSVAVRLALRRGADPAVGAFVTVTLAAALSAVLAVPSALTEGVDAGELWPFVVAGLIAPGASQIFLTFAVRAAGASRASIVMGTTPVISVLIALTLLEEPFRPLLIVGTLLIVLGGAALAGERERPAHFR